MIRTGVGLAFLLLLVIPVVLALLSTSMQQRQINRRLDRAMQDLARARAAIEEHHRRHGQYPDSKDEALPEEFSAFVGDWQGGAPFHHEQGRLARLDLFSPGRPYAAPLIYLLSGDTWVLASRGPDGEQQIDSSVFESPPLRPALVQRRYDPTNGAVSAGDLWTTNAVE